MAKINLGLSHRPCFDTTRFQVLSANEALCIACIRPTIIYFRVVLFVNIYFSICGVLSLRKVNYSNI